MGNHDSFYKDNINRNVIFPEYNDNRISSSHFYPLFFEDRDRVYDLLKENGVYCGMHYKRNDLYKPFKDFKKVNNLINSGLFND